MSAGKMDQLARLTALVYRQRQAELRDLTAEEARLRKAMTVLEQSRTETKQADHGDTVRQGLGADVLWQGWLDAQQRELNMELARLRARKDPVMHRMRQAFGRQQVTEALRAQAVAADRAQRNKRQD